MLYLLIKALLFLLLLLSLSHLKKIDMADKTSLQQDLDQLVKKYTHVPAKGGWEIPRKLFHYSIGKFFFLCFLHRWPGQFIM